MKFKNEKSTSYEYKKSVDTQLKPAPAKKCSCCGTRNVGVERGLSRLCITCWKGDVDTYNCCTI